MTLASGVAGDTSPEARADGTVALISCSAAEGTIPSCDCRKTDDFSFGRDPCHTAGRGSAGNRLYGNGLRWSSRGGSSSVTQEPRTD
jgi:hypothetical protein